jgi:hypothetical protein
MRKSVEQYIAECHHCQTNKRNRQAPEGLLQPLPLPKQSWEHITMDFLTPLPETARGYTAVLVVIDRLSKMAHFLPTRDDAGAVKTAQLFLDNIFKLYGLPRSITSNQDGQFMSIFWKELFNLLGTKLRMSTTKHPETDRQSERTIQTLEEYLHTFISYNQKDWDLKLPLGEFSYNASTQDSTHFPPFQVVNNHLPYTPATLLAAPLDKPLKPETKTFLKNINSTLSTCQTILQQLKFTIPPYRFLKPTPIETEARKNATQAQNRYTTYANKHRRPVTLKVGDYALLSTKDLELNQYTSRLNRALSARFIGPFLITKQITPVTFQLRIPGCFLLNKRFHASKLHKCIPPAHIPAAFTDYFPHLASVPIDKICGQRVNYTNNAQTFEYKVVWSNNEVHWVPARRLEQAWPLIILYENTA